MTNLVVGTIAALIMVVAAIAGLSYLGPVVEGAMTKSVVAAVLNGGAQIEGAETLRNAERVGYVYDDANPATDTLIAEGYISGVPPVPRSITTDDATWAALQVTPGAPPVVSLKLDRSKPAAIAFCQELTRRSSGTYGCTSDLSSVK